MLKYMQKDGVKMHKFTYEFLKDKTITSNLFSLSNIITDLKGKTDSKKLVVRPRNWTYFN